MTLLPLVERELRAESRSAFTYWLRFFGAVALMAVGAMVFSQRGLADLEGTQLFQTFHLTLFVSVWIVAMLMTADSISRERREGTLGLLFLTPLRPIEVVMAKGLAHGLRAVGVALATVPVLVVPFLMGGVSWQQVVASVLINFSALCWAMAAGILASSGCQTLVRALVMATILEIISLGLLLVTVGTAFDLTFGSGFGRGSARIVPSLLELGQYAVFSGDELMLWLLQRGNIVDASQWLFALGMVAAGSIAICWMAAALAAVNVRRLAQDKGPSIGLQRVEKSFCTPKFGVDLLRHWMRHLLERNPVGWLERRTWQGRMMMWSWMAIMVSMIICVAGAGAAGGGFSNGKEFLSWMLILGWMLVGSIALTASSSLRRERESGVIELLLVSPLSVQQIIGGRLRGIGGQFLPAGLLFFGSWLWLLQGFSNTLLAHDNGVQRGLIWIWFFLVTLLTIPVVGLYFSLRCRMFFVAFFWTALLGLGLPYFVSGVVSTLVDPNFDSLIPVIWWLAIGTITVWGVPRVLRRTSSAAQGLFIALGAAVGLVALVSFASSLGTLRWHDARDLLSFVMISSVLQIGIAVRVGGLLRRRMERREFSLPQ